MTTRAPATWTVMGRDTFAREDYVVGTFASEEAARRCIAEREARTAASQDADLQDTFWIVPPPGAPATAS